LDEVKSRSRDFVDFLTASAIAAEGLRQAWSGVSAVTLAERDAALIRVRQTCAACHKTHRN
jgi:hypothetical protein